MKEIIPNVLADRYTSTEMVKIWSPKGKILIERKFWIAALRAQQAWGIDIPDEAIEAYESAKNIIDLEVIRERELLRRHDVKARIEIFNQLAGYQLIHKPFTSRDLTDCVEQYQIYESLKLIRLRVVSTLVRMAKRAQEYSTVNIAGRSHDKLGQTIKLGKRFANWAEDLLIALHRLDQLIADYPFRGIKGPMGTQQDLIEFMGSEEAAFGFEHSMLQYLGLPVLLDSVGQTYPRSLDFEVVSRLAQLSSGPGNMARTLHGMGGDGFSSEGFSEDQTGSTGMPHKMNDRTCERIMGMVSLMTGYVVTAASLLGAQEYEGDVSCSIVRRVALSDAFFDLDGLYQGAMTILDEMAIFPEAIARELESALPLLSTTIILQEIMKYGIGREDAHNMIRVAAVGAIKAGKPETFLQRLANTPNMPLAKIELDALVVEPNSGASETQIREVCSKIDVYAKAYPEAVEYKPEPIL